MLPASTGDSKTFYWITPDVWEQTYPGITETVRSMYEQALGVSLSMDIQPYTVILQRLLEGTHPGQTPAWTNPPQDLDPTGEWNITHVSGGSSNFSQYNYPPAEEMIKGMRGELDVDKRKETASELLRIFLGVHPDHGVEGMTGQPSVMNAISPQVECPMCTTPKTSTSSPTPPTDTTKPGSTRRMRTTRHKPHHASPPLPEAEWDWRDQAPQPKHPLLRHSCVGRNHEPPTPIINNNPHRPTKPQPTPPAPSHKTHGPLPDHHQTERARHPLQSTSINQIDTDPHRSIPCHRDRLLDGR